MGGSPTRRVAVAVVVAIAATIGRTAAVGATPRSVGPIAIDTWSTISLPDDADRNAAASVPATRVPATTPASPRSLAAHGGSSLELVASIDRSLPIAIRPRGRVIGMMPATSRYYGQPIEAWVQDVSADGRWALVTVPYVAGDRTGWMRLRGLETSWTRITVEADLSRHEITVRRGDEVLFRAPAATGAPGSPTPVGRYFVTDRVAFPGGGVLGTYAFGISGIQPNLPAGWSGGDQLAIHGTNAPWTIGRSASAGCLRVSERVLERLKPLLRLGTPVEIHP